MAVRYIIFVRPGSPLFWIYCALIGLMGVVSLSKWLCDPETWRFNPPHPCISAPAAATAPAPPAPAAAPATKDEETRAMLSVHVPADAEVWLDGHLMTKTGPSRLYRTPPLTKGEEYEYEVRTRWRAAGKTVDVTRRVKVRAAGSTEIDFTRPQADEP